MKKMSSLEKAVRRMEKGQFPKCKYCKEVMLESEGCKKDYVIFRDAAGYGGEYFKRSRFFDLSKSGKCHDCGAKHGNLHHFGCDVERCPRCGGQFFIGCCWEEVPALCKSVYKYMKLGEPRPSVEEYRKQYEEMGSDMRFW